MSEKRLFLLDAYALIFRSYYAFISNPRINSRGENTSAVFGFLLTLEEILQNQKPTHIAVVFDPPTPTFRHEMFPAYKANRDATPEDIKRSVPWIKRLLEGFGIPYMEVPGFEADDVIGTLAKKAGGKGYATYMMTSDKDFAQLVTEEVMMYKPARSGEGARVWGVEEVVREFSVERPEQVIDLLALMGDSSDNIPGAPGVGPKTAKKLIAEWGSVENLLQNSHKLTGRIKGIIEDNREQIEISKRLATIEQDVPVEFNEEHLLYGLPDTEILKRLFEELEFRTTASRIFSSLPAARDAEKAREDRPAKKSREESSANMQGSLFGETSAAISEQSSYSTIADTPHEYISCDSDEAIIELVSKLTDHDAFCFDTETTSINPLESEIVAIAFSWEKGKGYMVRFPDDRRETERLLEMLREPLRSEKQIKVGHNLKFDIQVLGNYGIDVGGPLFDTMIAHYLLEPDNRHKLDFLSEVFLSYSMVPIDALIGSRGANQRSMRTVPPEELKEYAVEDADITWQLYRLFSPMLEERGMKQLAEKIEMPLVKVLSSMERKGIRLNKDGLSDYAEQLREEIALQRDEIWKLAGREFNIASPRQLGDVLFGELKLESKARKTRSGQYSTSEETLQRLVKRHPIIEKVLEFRGLTKLLSSYVETLPKLISPVTGRIHASFNQAVASTGRLSSNNPNLQNIPVRDERGRELRRAFVPEEGRLLVSADYSQIELRLMAHLSGDANMISDFRAGSDIHAATAAKIFGVSESEVTREMRSRAKTANFGIIYGISAFGLSERLSISRSEAKELIDGYFASYPDVKRYMDEAIAKARQKGFVTTIFGRRRYLPDINSRNQVVRGNAERNAINAPIQGSAADIIKIAMINIYERLAGEMPGAYMILQVHDELMFEVEPDKARAAEALIRDEMEGAVKLKVDMVVETGTGKNWLEVH